MSDFISGWYLIYTMPRYEKTIEKQLVDKGVNVFVPFHKVLRQWHDRKKVVLAPIFPSYVFVYLNSKQDFFSTLDAKGVLYYVRVGKDIVRVKNEIVNDIKLLVETSEIETSDEHFEYGQRLTIHEGPLSGYSCEIVESKGKKRILVRLNFLNKKILASLPKELVTKS